MASPKSAGDAVSAGSRHAAHTGFEPVLTDRQSAVLSADTNEPFHLFSHTMGATQSWTCRWNPHGGRFTEVQFIPQEEQGS